MTPPFPAVIGVSLVGAVLRPLIGGGLVLRGAGAWLGTFPSGTTTVDPAPAWLAAHPDSDLAIVKHGGAYAVLPPGEGGTGWCRPRIFLFASDGSDCGEVSFPDAGGQCSAQRLNVGRDGTVMQSVRLDSSITSTQCAWRWWPKLLR